MHRFRHGLVVGRFHPFHSGHDQLLDEAGRRCARVTVAVVTAPDDVIPAAVRTSWLLERRADLRVVEVSSASAIEDDADHPFDALVGRGSSDAALALGRGLAFVEPGMARRHVSLTSAAVHGAPERHWSLIPAPVRAWYAQRVVVLGAEASGSARLAEALAEALRCELVDDLGRTYAEQRPAFRPWSLDDFLDIAARQQVAEEAAARTTPVRWLVCNSDAFGIDTWHLRCIGRRPDAPLATVRAVPPPRLYVVTRPDFDVPGGGPMGGAEPRRRMHELLLRELATQDVPWVDVGGSLSARLRQVLDRLPELRLPSLSGIQGRRATAPSGRGGANDAEQ